MTISEQLLTNRAYGFPRGAERRVKPRILAVVHITGNPRNVGPGAEQGERDYANRAFVPGSDHPTAHYYVGRNGDAIHAVDERRFAAWSNGDVKSPNLSIPGVKLLVDLDRTGAPDGGTYNANEACYLEIECVGAATVALQWTDAQFDTVASLLAKASAATGIVIDRSTVLAHGDINSIDRANCAFLRPTREAELEYLITLARGKRMLAVTDERTDIEVTVPDTSPYYDLDGKTILDADGPDGPLPWRASPYGTRNGLRAIYANVAGERRIVLIRPAAGGVRVRPGSPEAIAEDYRRRLFEVPIGG